MCICVWLDIKVIEPIFYNSIKCDDGQFLEIQNITEYEYDRIYSSYNSSYTAYEQITWTNYIEQVYNF